ncbi:unnamed protein product [Sphagnum tenellum]
MWQVFRMCAPGMRKLQLTTLRDQRLVCQELRVLVCQTSCSSSFNCVSVERMERLRHPKSFTVEVRDGEDERRHVHARKEAQTSLWNSIYHSLSSSFVNGCSESAVVRMWESRRSMPHGVAVWTSAQAEDIHE